MTPAAQRVAFVGVGAMGLPMVRRLASSPDVDVTAFDTSAAARQAAARVTRVAGSLADAVRDAEVVCTMLPADPQVRDVAADLARVGRRGQVFADFSTVAASTIEHAARQLSARGIDCVSAACMKSVAAAETGELALFLSGSGRALERVRAIVERVAASWHVVEGLGAAKALKIANNFVVAGLGLALCEALVVAARLGYDPEAALTGLAEAGVDGWVARHHIRQHVLPGELDGVFSVRYMAKDLELATRLSVDAGSPAFFAGCVLSAYRGAVAAGDGDRYHPVVIRWLERAARLPSIWQPSPLTSESAPALEDLARGMRGVQGLVSVEGVALAASAGLGRRDAARLLQGGSAANPALARLAAEEAPADLSPEVLLADAEAGRRAAQTAMVPALTVEIGLHAALARMGGQARRPRPDEGG